MTFADANRLALALKTIPMERVAAALTLAEEAPRVTDPFPATRLYRVPLVAPGWFFVNPSILALGDETLQLYRAINYEGKPVANEADPLCSLNYLARDPKAPRLIEAPADWPLPLYAGSLGFDDLRLYSVDDELWAVGATCERNTGAYSEAIRLRIDGNQFTTWEVMQPAGPRHAQKNWMPVLGRGHTFLHCLLHVVDGTGATIGTPDPPFYVAGMRGGGQVIPWRDGYLAIVHEVVSRPTERLYTHRFVWLDDDLCAQRVTAPFVFFAPGIEFAAGLAVYGKRIAVSFGVADQCSAMAWFDPAEIAAALHRERVAA